MKAVFVAIGTFLFVYLLFAIGFWVYNIHNVYTNFKIPMNMYVSKHTDQLQNRIFKTAFNGAKKCTKYPSAKARQRCQNGVSRLLANTITEEEISMDKGKHDWPDDLFFVKQEGNKYYRLGWEGKFVDISKTTSPVSISLPFYIRPIVNQCKPFMAALNDLPDCEVIVSLSLPNDQTGYIIRRMGLTEEEDLPIGLLLLPFVGMVLVSSLISAHFFPIASQDIPLLLLPLIALIVSLSAALLAAYFVIKKRKTV